MTSERIVLTVWRGVRSRLVAARRRVRELLGRASPPVPPRREHHEAYWSQVEFLQPQFVDEEASILAGHVPDRYRRIADLVPGETVLEIGAGEGVLSLHLAEHKHHVIALDVNALRCQKARELQRAWDGLGRRVNNCRIVHGSVLDNLELLRGVDTVVANRVIYHFQDDVHPIFAAIADNRVDCIVLCGNASKARRWKEQGPAASPLGRHLRLATLQGMTELLGVYGYSVTKQIRRGDPIVVGRRQGGN